MRSERSVHPLITLALQAALLVGLAGAGWSVYRRLPPEQKGGADNDARHETLLRITLRTAPGDAVEGVRLPVQLYSIDVQSARREYFNERRPGVRFEDFINRRMGARQPQQIELDKDGQAAISIPPGKWWIHATLDGAQDITWRLPVNITGREQHVELTPANAYMKTKSF
ncbi:MAG: hypothetical protein ACR2GW_02170 [Pyrinomonadaceae bacterium]